MGTTTACPRQPPVSATNAESAEPASLGRVLAPAVCAPQCRNLSNETSVASGVIPIPLACRARSSPLASTRILGRRTAPFPPFRIPHRAPRGFTQDPSTDRIPTVRRTWLPTQMPTPPPQPPPKRIQPGHGGTEQDSPRRPASSRQHRPVCPPPPRRAFSPRWPRVSAFACRGILDTRGERSRGVVLLQPPRE